MAVGASLGRQVIRLGMEGKTWGLRLAGGFLAAQGVLTGTAWAHCMVWPDSFSWFLMVIALVMCAPAGFVGILVDYLVVRRLKRLSGGKSLGLAVAMNVCAVFVWAMILMAGFSIIQESWRFPYTVGPQYGGMIDCAVWIGGTLLWILGGGGVKAFVLAKGTASPFEKKAFVWLSCGTVPPPLIVVGVLFSVAGLLRW